MGNLTLVAHLKACAEAAKNFAAGLVAEVANTCSEALEEMDSLKQDKLTGTAGQIVGIDSSGNAAPVDDTFLNVEGGADSEIPEGLTGPLTFIFEEETAGESGLPEGGSEGKILGFGENGAEWVDNPVIAFGPQSLAASAWASDSTYSDYPYRASIALSGVTAKHVPSVNFNSTDALSGKLSPVSESYDGGVYIYATEALTEAVSVGSVTCIKAVSA